MLLLVHSGIKSCQCFPKERRVSIMYAVLSPPGDKSGVCVWRGGGGIFTPETPPCPPSLSSLTYRLQTYKCGRFLTLKIKPTRAEISLVSQLSSVSPAESCSCFSALSPSFLKKEKLTVCFPFICIKTSKPSTLKVSLYVVVFCCQTCVWHTHSRRITVPQSPPVVAETLIRQ